jgi:hypothetical protein
MRLKAGEFQPGGIRKKWIGLVREIRRIGELIRVDKGK